LIFCRIGQIGEKSTRILEAEGSDLFERKTQEYFKISYKIANNSRSIQLITSLKFLIQYNVNLLGSST